MRKFVLIALLLMFVAGFSGCGTNGVTTPSPAVPSVIEMPGQRLQPPPAELLTPEEENFLKNLLNFSSPKPTEPTK